MAEERRSSRGSADDERSREKEGKGSMTVEEAGHLGGQRVKELIEEGKKAEGEESSPSEGARSSRRGSGESSR
jgi:hypothetical protein